MKIIRSGTSTSQTCLFLWLEQEYQRAKLFNILAWSQIVKFHNIHRDGTDKIVGGKSMTNMFLY